jgi:hypothetical protein
MRIIDRKWTELAAGYQAARSLQARLENDFSRAVEVGYQQQHRKDVAGWQKKRRVFFAFVAIAPLSILTLCLSAYYFREVACVIVYWTVVVLVILVTLAVAARGYIVEVMNRPKLGPVDSLPMDLEKRWWTSLCPEELMASPAKGGAKADFLGQLIDLPDTCLARRGPPVEGEASLYIFAPSGPWIFTLRDWSGGIAREADLWKQVRKRSEAVVYNQAPDEQWLRLKEALASYFMERFPQTGGKVQGGVAFTNPKAHLDKTLIRGNTAAYGPASSWAERLRRAPSDGDGFTLEMQLETLDALTALEKKPAETMDPSTSAKSLAMRLYEEAAAELRALVAKMVR